MTRENKGLSSITKQDYERFKEYIQSQKNKQARTVWRYVYFLKKIPQKYLDNLLEADNNKDIKKRSIELITHFNNESGEFDFIKNIKLVSYAVSSYLKSRSNYEAQIFFFNETKKLFSKAITVSEAAIKIKYVPELVIQKILEYCKYDIVYTNKKNKGVGTPINDRQRIVLKNDYDAEKDYLLIKTLGTSGVRIAEALQIIFNNLFEDTDIIDGEEVVFYKIRVTGIGKGGKSGLRRITKELFFELKTFQKKYGKEDKDLLFDIKLEDTSYAKELSGYIISDRAASSIYLLERRIIKFQYMLVKIGLIIKRYDRKDNRLTPHMFRHAVGMLLYKKGLKLEKIQKILDHNDISTTQIYAQVEDRELDRDFENIWGKKK